MMGLWSQAGSTFNRVVKPRGSVDGDDNPPSDAEPDDTSILFVPCADSAPCLSLILTLTAEMKMKDQ